MNFVPKRKKGKFLLAGLFLLAFLWLSADIYAFQAGRGSLVYSLFHRVETLAYIGRNNDFYERAALAGKSLASDEYILIKLIGPPVADLSFVTDERDPFLRMYRLDKYSEPPFRWRKTALAEEVIAGADKGFLPANSFYRIYPSDFEKYLVDYTDDVVLKALYCSFLGYDRDDLAVWKNYFNRLDRGGYLTTHYLLALMFLAREGCLEKAGLTVGDFRAEVETAVAKMIGHIEKNLSDPEQSLDLLAEQIVFLYWLGRGDLVRHSWVEKLLGAQNDDGGWGWTKGALSDFHATGLVRLALEYHIEGKPFQPFFLFSGAK